MAIVKSIDNMSKGNRNNVLKSMSISTKKEDGQNKVTREIILDISRKLDTMSDNEKESLSILLKEG